MHGVALTVGSLHWLLERAQVLGFFGFFGFVGFFRFSGSQVVVCSGLRLAVLGFRPAYSCFSHSDIGRDRKTCALLTPKPGNL
jgi:hypothetical protein